MVDKQQLLWLAGVATYYEAIGGLVIGTVAGVAVAFATARWSTARDVMLPVAVGASAIPLIAAAPIMINWFGLLDPLSMMMMAALLVFFPVMINVTRGLVQVQPASLELMRSYATTPTEVLRMVRDPEHAAVLLHRPQGRHHPRVHRCHRGRVLRRRLQGPRQGRHVVHGQRQLRPRVGGHRDRRLRARSWPTCIVSLVERWTIPWYTALRAGP